MLHLLVGLTETSLRPASDFASRFARALIGLGGAVLIVLWDAMEKTLRLATIEELEQLALPTEFSGRAALYPKIVICVSSCKKILAVSMTGC